MDQDTAALNLVTEALDGLATELEQKILEHQGDLGAGDAKLWQRCRDALDGVRLTLDAKVQSILEAEHDEWRRARDR